jgi:hypothetical protein
MPEPILSSPDAGPEAGVVPISKAATLLAALLKRAPAAPAHHHPEGQPSGVLLDIEVYEALRGLAARHRRGGAASEG